MRSIQQVSDSLVLRADQRRTKAVACLVALLLPLVQVSSAYAQELSASPATQLSVGTSSQAPNAGSNHPYRSPNANITVFDSAASNLVTNDTNGFNDVFLVAGNSAIQRVSVGSKNSIGQNPEADGDSGDAAVSPIFPDKTYGVVFVSKATNLDPSCPNPQARKQIYLRVPHIDKTVMISARRTLSTGQCIAGDRDSLSPRIAIKPSPNRFVIAYLTDAENLVDTDPQDPLSGPRQVQPFMSEAVLRSDSTVAPGPPSTTPFKLNAPSYEPALSGNGRILVFSTLATNILNSDPSHPVGNDKRQIWIIDIEAKRAGLVTEIRTGESLPGEFGDGDSYNPSITFQGDSVAFLTLAPNLGSDGQNAAFVRISKRDKIFRRINTSSEGTIGNGSAIFGMISPNGLLATWSDSSSNLIPNDTNNTSDIFVKEFSKDRTTRVNLAVGNTEALGGQNTLPSMGADGFTKLDSQVAFVSTASNLVSSGSATQGQVYTTSLDVPPPPIVKNLPIETPPDVIVQKRKVTFTLQEFSSSSSSSSALISMQVRATAKTRISYTLELTNTKTKKKTIKQSNRNRITISRLNPGTYTARYRATSTSSSGKKTNTKYSPTQKLTVS